MGAKAAPAESILEEKVVPGSCWPMDGSHGQVTIRLPYTIKVESFTLDHVSRRIIPDDMLETAPKKVKVIAYPPCSHPEECGGLGFDVSEPMEVAQFEYDIEGSISQTFNSVFVSALPPVTNEIDGDGSCSAEAAACTSPPHIDVAAITLKVTENYGSPDYTCIYRFRVHGSQVF
jgi:Sad1 / UNC-like C-terminal